MLLRRSVAIIPLVHGGMLLLQRRKRTNLLRRGVRVAVIDWALVAACAEFLRLPAIEGVDAVGSDLTRKSCLWWVLAVVWIARCS